MSQQLVDPAAMRAAVDFVSALSADRYAQALADYIMIGDDEADNVFGTDSLEPISRDAARAAFHSLELMSRSIVAARYLIDEVNTVIRTRAPRLGLSGKQAQRYREEFRNRVGRERRFLKITQDYHRGQRGILDISPNPTRRAQERLWQLALQGEVPAGTALRLRAEELAKVATAKAEAKNRAKQARIEAHRAVSL